MSTLTIPMHWQGGHYVQLQALLAFVNQPDLIWAIIEFDGVGIMPAGLAYADFQAILRRTQTGYILTWQELLCFAENIEYTIDCLIVAVSDVKYIEKAKLLADDFDACAFAFRAIDSTEWLLGGGNTVTLKDIVIGIEKNWRETRNN